jgi:hypothetical protein
MESAESYIKEKIINSHPEVAEFIQSRKAATSILEFQKGNAYHNKNSQFRKRVSIWKITVESV